MHSLTCHELKKKEKDFWAKEDGNKQGHYTTSVGVTSLGMLKLITRQTNAVMLHFHVNDKKKKLNQSE